MTVNSRLELKEYCLRKLGAPVIAINVDDGQLEDRLDDAIIYFNDWHIDGVERLYMKHQMTPTTLNFSSAVAPGTFLEGDLVQGATTGAVSMVYKQAANNLSVTVWQTGGLNNPTLMFVPGETLIGPRGNATISPIVATAIVVGDLDNQWVPIPPQVISIVRIFPISATITSNFLFDPVYYNAFDLIWNFNGLDLISYESMKQRINFINQILVGEKPVRFNRYQNQLKIDFDWKRSVAPGSWVIIECYRTMNPEDYTQIYNDFFLKEYTTALFKIQWGENLSKFGGIQLPGGVTLNGERILNEGMEAKEKLEDQMKSGRWSMPLGFTVG